MEVWRLSLTGNLNAFCESLRGINSHMVQLCHLCAKRGTRSTVERRSAIGYQTKQLPCPDYRRSASPSLADVEPPAPYLLTANFLP